MAYIIVTFDHEEIDRRSIGGTLVIGRSPECSLCVRDIQLSRRHCQLTRTADGWVLMDLESRNGTYVNGRKVWRHLLRDGDVARMGRVRVAYREGEMEPPPRPASGRRSRRRPSNPAELLGETLLEFDFSDPEIDITPETLYPRPRPVNPASYEREGVYDMVETIASSSWDSILVENSRPVVMERKMPRPIVRKPGEASAKFAPAKRRRSEADLMLQVRTEPALPRLPLPPPEPAPVRSRWRFRWPGYGLYLTRQRSMILAAVMVWLAALVLAVEGILHG